MCERFWTLPSPLYYAHTPKLFAFASELQAICAHPDFAADFDLRAVQKYFAHGYVPAPNAVYKNSHMLPAGHNLLFEVTTGNTRVWCYWRFRCSRDNRLLEANEDALAEELRALVLQSVERRLMADVPLGLFLSGGIDSSIVLAAMAKLRPPEEINTFCIGFDEPSFDESAFARETAAFYRARHREQEVAMADALEQSAPLLQTLGEPLGDPSFLPTSILAGFARRHVTVALSGDGGDELFAGYDPFAALKPAARYQKLVPTMLHRLISRLVGKLPISDRNMSLDFKLRRALKGVGHPPEFWNPVWLSPLAPEDFGDMFSEPLPQEELYSEALACWHDGEGDLLDNSLNFYVNSYLQNGILTKVDRAAMASSLETRAIFLDNDLVEFCQKLPNRFKVYKGQRKYLLRKAFADYLPAQVLKRPKKGFGIPLNKWLRTLSLPAKNWKVPGINEDWIERCWENHRAGHEDHRLLLWSWMSF